MASILAKIGAKIDGWCAGPGYCAGLEISSEVLGSVVNDGLCTWGLPDSVFAGFTRPGEFWPAAAALLVIIEYYSLATNQVAANAAAATCLVARDNRKYLYFQLWSPERDQTFWQGPVSKSWSISDNRQ